MVIEFTFNGSAIIAKANGDNLAVEIDRNPGAETYAPKPIAWNDLTLEEQTAIEQEIWESKMYGK